jgi:opacity protein-like surface antigen
MRRSKNNGGVMMRVFVALSISVLWLATPASAQSAAAGPSRGYVEAVAQSAFGNVTSQSFGVEGGVTVAERLSVFVEGGQMRDTSPSSVGASAQLVAGFLSQTQNGVAFSVRQPVTFGVGGIRYTPATSSPTLAPYVLGGVGIARVRKDVAFSVGGTDVTGNVQQLGVVLGSDLSGSEIKPMLSVGAGVAWAAWRQLVVDFQYRYGRVLTSDQGLNTNRAGIGVGVRF